MGQTPATRPETQRQTDKQIDVQMSWVSSHGLCRHWPRIFLLLLLLIPAHLGQILTPDDPCPDPENLGESSPNPTFDPSSHPTSDSGSNLTFDPRTLTLTWACGDNTTTRTECWARFGEETVNLNLTSSLSPCICVFHNLVLHRGAEFEVRVTRGGQTVTKGLEFTNLGPPGSEAADLRCRVLEARMMNCSWAPGPQVPRGTQYSFFLRDHKTGRDLECPQYTCAAGLRLGCLLPNVSSLRNRNYALITASSGRFLDAWLLGRELEVFSPPPNVTVTCDASGCIITWARPRTWRRLSKQDFLYHVELQTRAGRQEPPIEVPGESYLLPGPEPRVRGAVRVRAGDSRTRTWGEWSHPVEFGSEVTPKAGRLVLLLLAVLGSLLCALGLGWGGCRLLHGSTLCDPGPRVKDKLMDTGPGQEVTWRDLVATSDLAEPEHLSPVEELEVPDH